jgi:hypothetical protein
MPLLLGMASCSTSVQGKNHSIEQPNIADYHCPILKSEKWHVWLDKFTEKKGQYRLIVNGQITLPTPGFTMRWFVDSTDRMHPPSLRLMLQPKASNLITIQVLTTVPVEYTLETSLTEFNSVLIYCGEKLLSRIEGVNLTD